MKKVLLSLCLIVLLVSCGGQTPANTPVPPSASVEEAAQTLLDSKAFSEKLEGLDADIAVALYSLEVVPSQCAAFLSTGATAEECTFLLFEKEEDAQAAVQRFQIRLEEQIAALENYQPAEISKLEQAIHGYCFHKDGFMAYLVVAEDAAAAQDAVSGLVS